MNSVIASLDFVFIEISSLSPIDTDSDRLVVGNVGNNTSIKYAGDGWRHKDCGEASILDVAFAPGGVETTEFEGDDVEFIFIGRWSIKRPVTVLPCYALLTQKLPRFRNFGQFLRLPKHRSRRRPLRVKLELADQGVVTSEISMFVPTKPPSPVTSAIGSPTYGRSKGFQSTRKYHRISITSRLCSSVEEHGCYDFCF